VHSSRCGWHAGWGAGGWHFNQVSEQKQTDDALANVSTEVPSVEQEASPAPAQEGWNNDTGLHAALQQWGVSFCSAHRVGYFCNQYTRVRCCRNSWGYSMCGSTVHSSRCGWHAGWGAGGWHAGGWRAGGWHFNQVIEQNQTDDALANVSTEVPSVEQEVNPAPAQEGWDNDTGLHAALQTWGVSFCSAHRVGYFCNGHTQVRCCRAGRGYSMCGSTRHSTRCGWRAGWTAGSSGASATASAPGSASVQCGGFKAGGCSCRHVRGCRCAGVKAGGCAR